jgi:predicted DNA-binding transcriptional regulator YafY
MDILKHGSGVEVLGPTDLKKKIIAELGAALAVYKN